MPLPPPPLPVWPPPKRKLHRRPLTLDDIDLELNMGDNYFRSGPVRDEIMQKVDEMVDQHGDVFEALRAVRQEMRLQQSTDQQAGRRKKLQEGADGSRSPSPRARHSHDYGLPPPPDPKSHMGLLAEYSRVLRRRQIESHGKWRESIGLKVFFPPPLQSTDRCRARGSKRYLAECCSFPP